MAKQGTLPNYVYQRELADSSTYYVRQDQSTSEEKASATIECTSMEQEEDDEIEYDESTDEEGRPLKNLMTKLTLGNQIDKSATFLQGRTTGSGSAVRLNSIPVFCSNKVRS